MKFILWGLSYIYRLGLEEVKLAYRVGIIRQDRLAQPVISIGNITWGGAGKTPLVEYLARYLKEHKCHPAVLTRGYMGEAQRSSDDSGESDEALMLRDNLKDVPVICGKNRIESAQKVPAGYPADVFILDDGFQHWRLKRDLDIAVIDATNPFGNRHLLPRGILREPVSSLKRADVLVLTKTDLAQDRLTELRNALKRINPQALIVQTVHQPLNLEELRRRGSFKDLTSLRNKRVCACCSIADPAAFMTTLRSCGAEIVGTFEFIDHHRYTPQDVDRMVRFCRDHQASVLVTTQKDAVKLTPLLQNAEHGLEFWSLRIQISVVQVKEEFLNKIQQVCRN